jgi:hypothetical protein
MRKLSKLAVLVCAGLSSSVMAKSLEGIVTREDGKAIANAKVEIEGLGIQTPTDSSGRFVCLK